MTLANEFDRVYSAPVDSPPSPPSAQRPAPIVKYTPDGTIDEDIFCLSCGYNLRGLRGDPVRCPECGGDNQLGDIVVPALYIRAALKELESAPTRCVASAATSVTLLALAFVAEWPYSIVLVVLAAGFGAEWMVNYQSFVATVDDRAAVHRILLRFHLITLLCTSAIPFWAIAVRWTQRAMHEVSGTVWLWSIVASLPLMVLGLALYPRTQRERHRVQREAAVRIARDILRKELTSRKRASG